MLLSCSRFKAVTSVSSEAGSDIKSITCGAIRTVANVDAVYGLENAKYVVSQLTHVVRQSICDDTVGVGYRSQFWGHHLK